MAKTVHKAVVRGITRTDLNDSIEALSTLVDAKLDTVLVKVESVHETIRTHIAQEDRTTAEIRRDVIVEADKLETKHQKQYDELRNSVEGLKRYRWMLVGAIAVIGALIEFGPTIVNFLHGKP